MTPDKIDQIRSAFDEFDDDNDGEIEVQMLERALRSYGLIPSPEEIEQISEDLNQSPTVSFNTFAFLVFRMSKSTNPEKELLASFRLFDRDGTGKIPYQLTRSVLTNLKRPLTEVQLETLLGNIEIDNGFIDYRVLVKRMLTN